MMNRMAFTNYQSMNMVHRTKDGTELWLGDYYAASNTSLLKQKNIKSGKSFIMKCLHLQPCLTYPITKIMILITRSLMHSISPAIK